MIEDNLTAEERIRLEALAQAVQLVMATPLPDGVHKGSVAVSWAQEFESFISGRLEPGWTPAVVL